MVSTCSLQVGIS